jgi:glycosyltransferase involved in cell wall biosynthesis
VSETRRLTVAVPTCNGTRHLGEALESILAQEGIEFDLMVVDDRSDDETVAVAREVAGDRARIEVNSERLGLAGNWNRCVDLCGTPLVAIFHQDDVMYPGHLAAHVEPFAKDSTVGLVCGAADVIDAAGNPIPPEVVGRGEAGPGDRVYTVGQFVREMAVSNPVRCSAAALRVSAHAEVGGFDPSYRYVVDWEFWLRVARHWGVAWLASPTAAVRWHSESETHRFKKGTEDLDETRKLLDDLFWQDGWRYPDARALRRQGERRLARAFLNRAHDALRAGDPSLSRTCLRRALTLSPGLLGTIALDPRLAAQMAAVAVAPKVAGRWLGRGTPAG